MEELLRILEKNARMPIEDIAAMLDKTPEENAAMMDEAAAKGYIRGYETLEAKSTVLALYKDGVSVPALGEGGLRFRPARHRRRFRGRMLQRVRDLGQQVQLARAMRGGIHGAMPSLGSGLALMGRSPCRGPPARQRRHGSLSAAGNHARRLSIHG